MVAYIIAIALGGAVGAIELGSRYKDRPEALLWVLSAWIYVFVNAGAAAFALALAHVFNWTFGLHPSTTGLTIIQVVVCSTGAMAVFRCSFATIKIGDQLATIGPNAALTALLSMADRAVDRNRASSRSKDVSRIMKNVSFDKAFVALPTYCLALLQNVSADEQSELANAINALVASATSDALKSLNLGLLLMNIAGVNVLEAAVDALRAEIQSSAQQPRTRRRGSATVQQP